jgi:hypothetical protein
MPGVRERSRSLPSTSENASRMFKCSELLGQQPLADDADVRDLPRSPKTRSAVARIVLEPQSGDHEPVRGGDRLEALAAIFGIEVISFAVMSNHLHVILRTCPDVATAWSPEEIVRRWRELFPMRRAAGVAAAGLPSVEVVEDWRSRLSSLSWFIFGSIGHALNLGTIRRPRRSYCRRRPASFAQLPQILCVASTSLRGPCPACSFQFIFQGSR